MAKELENTFDKVSQEVSKATEDVKETMHEVGGRWNKSSLEEKITTIIGIIFVARGLIQLREFIWGVVLLILGGLLVSGYFNNAIKSLIKFCKGDKKEKKVEVHHSAPTKAKKSTSKETKK